MDNSDELLLLSLEPAEARTLLALRHLASPQRLVEATAEELGVLTGYSPATLRRALRGLEERGLVLTTRTKKGFGKFSANRYTLVEPSLTHERSEAEPSLTDGGVESLPSLTDERSTHGQVVSMTTINTKDSHTMYNYKDSHMRKNKYKEVLVGAERWKPKGEDTSGDDEIGGFGLFEDERPAVVKHKLSTDKRDPKTRGRRPQEEWTAADVSVEFSYQLARKYPYLPGTFQTSPLRGALAKNRKQYGITPLIELEVLRLFLGDERNHKDAEQKPDMLYKRYLKMFQTHMGDALKNLGMPSMRELADADLTHEKIDEFVYSSDGRAFDNSIPGRRMMQKYEEKLKSNAQG
jgi:DNA-binding transcriptional ArsR family regulator